MFESRWSLRMFSGLYLSLHNCEALFHFYSLSAVHSYDLYHIDFVTACVITEESSFSYRRNLKV